MFLLLLVLLVLLQCAHADAGWANTAAGLARAERLVHARLTRAGLFDALDADLAAVRSDPALEGPARAAREAVLLDDHVRRATAALAREDEGIADRVRHAATGTALRQQQPQSRRRLLMDSDGGSDENGNDGLALTEPTPECRRILNVWTSRCVFSDDPPK